MVEAISQIFWSEYFSANGRFIFIAVDSDPVKLVRIFEFFESLGILNLIVIVKTSAVDFTALTYIPNFNQPGRKYYLLDNKVTNVETVFPDKLLNLNGYAYKSIFYVRPPRLFSRNGKIYGPEVFFMETFAKKQGATLELIQVSDEANGIAIVDALLDEADVCLNTDAFLSKSIKSVNTFDTDGFCALVPHPKIKSHFDFIYKPFDLSIWILVLLSMLGGTAVWHFLNKTSLIQSNSAGYFLFGFLSGFVGQTISFRRHRRMQKIVLQLTILLTFMLSTLYESQVISMMSDSSYGKRITTIDELVDGDYSFHVSRRFSLELNGSEHYQKMSSRIVKPLETLTFNYKQTAADNVVLVDTCSLFEDILEHPENYFFGQHDKPSMFYYKLDQSFSSFSLKFPIAEFSQIQQRLEEWSLRVFESGIKQASTTLNPLGRTPFSSIPKIEEDQILMNLGNIAPAFYMLAFGLILAAIVFLLEIFYHDFLNKFQSSQFSRIFKKFTIKRHRVIQVRQANEYVVDI